MSFRDGLKGWLDILIKIGLVIIVLCSITYIAFSIIGNVFEKSPDTVSGLPSFPSTSKANYAIIIKNTNEVLFTNKYDKGVSPEDASLSLYTLHNYYEVRGNKYKLIKITLPMDEYYYGPIIIYERSK